MVLDRIAKDDTKSNTKFRDHWRTVLHELIPPHQKTKFQRKPLFTQTPSNQRSTAAYLCKSHLDKGWRFNSYPPDMVPESEHATLKVELEEREAWQHAPPTPAEIRAICG